MATWLVPATSDRNVRVRVLAGTVVLSTQVGTGELNAGGNPVLDLHPRGSRNTPSCFMFHDHELRPNGPLGTYAGFTMQFCCKCCFRIS